VKLHRARVDDNQALVVAALRAAGVQVRVMSEVGGGFPDLLCKHRKTGELLLLEVKDGAKPPSARALTPMEKKFAAIWPVHVVVNAYEALMACGAGEA
jgi:hypothetical protein